MSGARAVLPAIGLAALLLAWDAGAQEAPPPAEQPAPPPVAQPEAQPAPPAAAAEGDGEEGEDEDEDHAGFLFRFTLGLGWGWARGEGALEPAIGLRRIDDPRHDSPAFNLSLDLGGGFRNLGLHAGAVMERMILRADAPTEMGFTLFGVGGGLSYYFSDHDFYVTAQLRFVGLLLYLPGVACDAPVGEKYQSYRGPGLTFGLGKEWYGDDDRGLGLGLQLNWARLAGGADGAAAINYVSAMLALTFTKF